MKYIFFNQDTAIRTKTFTTARPLREFESMSVVKRQRIQSIDLLRGIVMIIMALDHVRDYFHADAFLYSPTDLSRTNAFLFFTRFITHYCAPVFVFLAGISAYLYGINKSRRELAWYLFTRGVWMLFAELFIISLLWTFNPSYPMFNLQVIWAIGISMIVLSALVYLHRNILLLVALIIITCHNMLDNIHVPGTGSGSFLWALLHEDRDFVFGHFKVLVHFPVLPWIGIIALGYCFGILYNKSYDASKRKMTLFITGCVFLMLFIFLRSPNLYGDPVKWSGQKDILFTILSLFNVSKYPPSLLYILVTLGPALIFLSLAEQPLNSLTRRITVFGRVPFFYYVAHIFVIHALAMFAALVLGYNWSDMILTTRVNRVPWLKGYGFSLPVVYFVWFGIICFLYPFCKWFDRYKRAWQGSKRWLSYV